jgi:hypothetical protein
MLVSNKEKTRKKAARNKCPGEPLFLGVIFLKKNE